jgi:hypothetical protein
MSYGFLFGSVCSFRATSARSDSQTARQPTGDFGIIGGFFAARLNPPYNT